jgi:hypothetical protein
LDPYVLGHYRLGVANDVFNGVGTPGLVVLPCRTRSTAWHCALRSPGTVVLPDEWSTVLALHCSHTVAAYPYILQALTTLLALMSCMPTIALTSGALETCEHALGTFVPSCIGRPARLFFMLVTHDP